MPVFFQRLILFGVLLGGVSPSVFGDDSPLLLRPEDGDVTLFNDITYTSGFLVPDIKLCPGDFNGNGYDDLAFGFNRLNRVDLFLDPATRQGSFSSGSSMTITWDDPTLPPGPAKMLLLADINTDGKDDLFISLPPEIHVLWGQSVPPREFHLSPSSSNLKIIGPAGSFFGSSLAKGDFNGDGADDVAVGASGQGAFYLILGNSSFAPGIVNLATQAPYPKITKSGFGDCLAVGDFNGDGKSDLAMSDPQANAGGRILNGEVHIVFGRTVFPPIWSIGSPAADVRLIGRNLSRLNAVSAGDLTGDHKAELIVQPFHFSSSYGVRAIDGQEVASGKPLLDDETLYGTTSSVVLFGGQPIAQGGVQTADFDLDGAEDVFGRDFTVYGFLTSNERPGEIALPNVNRTSLQWNFTYSGSSNNGDLVVGDWNGDGHGDLAVYEDFLGTYPPYGALRLVMGFWPLGNPGIHIEERSPNSPRVTLDLRVDGEPNEVLLTGDVADGYRDRWLPYHPRVPVDLTSAEGPKTVQATFRNSLNRQSEIASDTVALAVGEPGTERITNVLRPGGRVRYDCHLTAVSHVKAEVFNREGTSLGVIVDEEWTAGVWPVVWDGKNASGQSVVPGLYVLVVSVNGHRESHKVVVQG